MKHTEKFLKQRKFYLMLPILVFPFLTLTFWALGGGKSSAVQARPISEGLATNLPNAQFESEREEDLWDKFSLYETAARDSAAYETARENDPYFDLVEFESAQRKPTDEESKLIGTFKRRDQIIDPNEQKVNRKLDELYAEISRAAVPDESGPQDVAPSGSSTESTTEITALESMMEELHADQAYDREDIDPEMVEINTMLDKLLDIQNPERIRNRKDLNKESDKQPKVFAVSVPDSIAQAGRNIITNQSADSTAFAQNDPGIETTTIQAAIHETQTLVTGAMVRLRLLNDITLNGQPFPQDNFIYGICSINGERMFITINTIVNADAQVLIPVSLSVYDLDGIEGIYIPGAISRDAAKQASDDAVQNIQLSSFDQSIEAQAATAGIEATKNLLSRKAKLIRITVKAGHKVFLLNKS